MDEHQCKDAEGILRFLLGTPFGIIADEHRPQPEDGEARWRMRVTLR